MTSLRGRDADEAIYFEQEGLLRYARNDAKGSSGLLRYARNDEGDYLGMHAMTDGELNDVGKASLRGAVATWQSNWAQVDCFASLARTNEWNTNERKTDGCS